MDGSAAADPAKNPVSELAEALVALKAPAAEWQTTKSGEDHKLQWLATATVTLPGDSSRGFSGGLFSSISEAKADAATLALRGFVRDVLQRLPKRATGPAVAPTCVSLLHEFCTQYSITIEGGEFRQADLFGWKSSLRWPNGDTRDDWFYSPAKFTSKAAAKKEAALCAVDHLLAHQAHGPYLHSLVQQLPSSERRAETVLASHAPTLPQIRRPQVRGQQFCAVEGSPLLETRHLELKGVDETLPEAQRWKGVLQCWLTGSKNGFEEKHAAVYMSAYLNAGVPGRIVLGVNDSGTVQGIPMTAADVDQLSNTWAQRLNAIWPHIPHGSGLVSEPILIAVTETGSARTDLKLIVFEVTPQPGPHLPYFWDKIRSRAHKKVEATILPISADELTALIITAHRNGVSP